MDISIYFSFQIFIFKHLLLTFKQTQLTTPIHYTLQLIVKIQGSAKDGQWRHSILEREVWKLLIGKQKTIYIPT